MPRILWIDDDLTFTSIGAKMLRSAGYECDVAGSNEEAIHFLRREIPYDLVISDIMRPPGNFTVEETEYGLSSGIVFCRRYLRQSLPHIPVVFVTATADSSRMRFMLNDLGNCRVLRKPTSTQVIIAAVEALLIETGERLYSHIDRSTTAGSIIQVDFRAVTEQLLKYLAKNPTALHDLSPRRFEELIARVFEDRGYDVTLTPETRDGGVDLYAAKRDDVGELLYVIECKKYSPKKPVGVGHVRSLYGVKNDKNASAGILVSTSFFTQPAQSFQRSHCYELSLSDYDRIKKWLRRYLS